MFKKLCLILACVFLTSRIFAMESTTDKLKDTLSILNFQDEKGQKETYNLYRNYIIKLLTNTDDPPAIDVFNPEQFWPSLNLTDYALKFDDREILEILFKLRGDLLKSLLYAARTGKIKLIRMLIQEYNVDPNQEGEDGRTALEEAAYWDQMEAVHVLMEYNPSEDNISNALIAAGEIDASPDIIEVMLVEHNANVNSQDVNNQTLLMHLAGNTNDHIFDNVQTLDSLVRNHNANLMLTDEHTFTALEIAAERNAVDQLIVLLAYGTYGRDRVVRASSHAPLNSQARKLLETYRDHMNLGSYACMIVLLNFVVKLHSEFEEDGEGDFGQDYIGLASLVLEIMIHYHPLDTVLHRAVRSGHLLTMEMLLQNSHEYLNTLNSRGQTPLFLAISLNIQPMIIMLTNAQAIPTIGTQSSLQLANTIHKRERSSGEAADDEHKKRRLTEHSFQKIYEASIKTMSIQLCLFSYAPGVLSLGSFPRELLILIAKIMFQFHDPRGGSR